MENPKRVFLIVLDSFGIGAEPDAADYGDEGSNTLCACATSGKLVIPHMTELGLLNIDGALEIPMMWILLLLRSQGSICTSARSFKG